jgi:uncharacterized protein YndB with AHSA1/START domain
LLVGIYRFSVHVEASPEIVFGLWTDLDRMPEWVGGVTRITDRTGPIDRVGTRYVVWFGGMRSETEVLDVEPARRFRTRFGNRILRGENLATFEPDGTGMRLTQEFRTDGLIAAIAARIFASGSYRGSFRGELRAFAAVAERESNRASTAPEAGSGEA